MPQSPRAGSSVALALSPLIALGLTACSSDQGPSAEERAKKYEKVISDPKPKAQDVIDVAGAPVGAARGEDGSTVLSFYPRTVEDDEGPAAYAWRLYSPDGETVADRAKAGSAEMPVPGSFHSVPDGFLFAPTTGGRYFLLDTSGKKHPVKTESAPRATRPGDVWAADDSEEGGFNEPVAYRPSTRSVAPVPVPQDTEYVQGLTLDEQRGTAWRHAPGENSDPSRIVDSAGSDPHPLPAGLALVDQAAGGGTYVGMVDRNPDNVQDPELHLTRDGKNWRTVRSTKELPLKDFEWPDLDVLSNGMILVTDMEKHRAWLGSADGSRFTELTTPADFVQVTASGKTLIGFADSPTGDVQPVDGEGVWVSTDGGREWEQFRDGEL